MPKFVSRDKMSKKARRELDSRQRAAWSLSPVTRKVESKKVYNRKKNAHTRFDDSGMGVFSWLFQRRTALEKQGRA